MRRKGLDIWCIEHESVVTEIHKLIKTFLDNQVTYHYPVRNIQVDHEHLRRDLEIYLYKTSNNSN